MQNGVAIGMLSELRSEGVAVYIDLYKSSIELAEMRKYFKITPKVKAPRRRVIYNQCHSVQRKRARHSSTDN